MNDTTGSKPMWTRCQGCKDRVYNDKLDIGIHRGHCPADLQRSLQSLKRQFEELKELVDGLDEQVSTEPAVDPDGVAPWPGDSNDDDGYDEDPGLEGQEYDDDETLALPATIGSTLYAPGPVA